MNNSEKSLMQNELLNLDDANKQISLKGGRLSKDLWRELS